MVGLLSSYHVSQSNTSPSDVLIFRVLFVERTLIQTMAPVPRMTTIPLVAGTTVETAVCFPYLNTYGVSVPVHASGELTRGLTECLIHHHGIPQLCL